jgi:alpha-1,2-mannosyltransferase
MPRTRSIPSQNLWIWLLIALIAHSIAYGCVYVNRMEGGLTPGGDFPAFWSAAHILASGGNAGAVYNTAPLNELLKGHLEETIPALPYPPPLLMLIAPLGHLPYIPSLLAWLLLTGFFYVIATCATPVWRECREALSTSQRRIALMFIVASPFALYNAIAGQSGFLMAGLMIAGLALLPRHPWFAGMCFGLLAMKPQLALMVPVFLLLAREWRCIIAALVTAILLIQISAGHFGGESWQLYMHYLQVYTAALNAMPEMMMTLNGSLYWVLKTRGIDPNLVFVVQALFVAYAFWSLTQLRYASAPLQGALLVTATFIAAPYIMIYDTTLWILPVLYWLPDILRGNTTALERMSFLLLLLAPIFALQLTGWPVIFAVALLNHVALLKRA